MGWIRGIFSTLKTSTEALFMIEGQLKRIADALEKKAPREVVSGADPEVMKILNTPDTMQRKRYRGTYTDEQSISSKIGRKVKRSELKDAASAVGVSYIQDETNHHVYVKNTVLNLVLDYLKNATKK